MAKCLALLLVFCLLPAGAASAQNRSLKLYYLHTGEKATITYKRDGKYIDGGLKKVNRFLRDWRRNEPTKMDPRLLDLVWEVYKESGSKDYIHVISGYRSPATNKLLKKRGRGVASKSQHILGKALDFYLPDVKLSKLRKIGLLKQRGGVGFYPKSGSPFVHIDTGSVRHWPRMSRSQLVRIFPDGKTLHVPSDRKPLKRYDLAKADYDRNRVKEGKIVIAKAADIEKRPNFFQRLLGGGADDEEDQIANNTPLPKPVKTTTEPARSVSEPANPVIAAVEPASLPIPTLSPRREVANIPFEIAALEPENTEPLQEPVEEAPELAVAIPQKRPEYAAPVEEILTAANSETEPEAILTQVNGEFALVEPASPIEPQAPKPEILVAALTPAEIEDMRRQITDAATATATDKTLPKSPPEKSGPVIIASIENPIPNEPATQAPRTEEILSIALEPIDPQLSAANLTTDLEQNTGRDKIAADVFELASLEPIEPETVSSDKTAIPSLNPLRQEETAEPLLVAAFAPIDPDLRAGNGISIPIPNPQRARTADIKLTIEPEIAVSEPTQLASIPVPQINPRRIEQDPVETVAAALSVERPVLASRTISLEEFSMPDIKAGLIGKWALATNISIAGIADIRLPAYGRNAIRQLPSTVLTRGFARDHDPRASNRFTGSSVEFLDFAKFKGS